MKTAQEIVNYAVALKGETPFDKFIVPVNKLIVVVLEKESLDEMNRCVSEKEVFLKKAKLKLSDSRYQELIDLITDTGVQFDKWLAWLRPAFAKAQYEQ